MVWISDGFKKLFSREFQDRLSQSFNLEILLVAPNEVFVAINKRVRPVSEEDNSQKRD